MKRQFDRPPTREFMIEEFGADPKRLAHAEESIRSCAAKADNYSGFDKAQLTKGEVAYVLSKCGLIESFALYCTRLEGVGGVLQIFPTWLGAPVSGLLRVYAEFENSGELKALSGTLDKGGPFDFYVDALWFLPRSDLESIEWQEAQRTKAIEYEMYLGSIESYPWPDLLTVVRYPLSRSQAYRKFIVERWYDPDVRPLERIACPLDRILYEKFRDEAKSVDRRFIENLAKALEPNPGQPCMARLSSRAHLMLKRPASHQGHVGRFALKRTESSEM